MWTGNLNDVEWDNQYDEKTGNYYVGAEKVLRRHGSWEKAKKNISKHIPVTKWKIITNFFVFLWTIPERVCQISRRLSR